MKMRHGNPDFHPDIIKARRKLSAAQSNLRRVVREVQSTCRHPAVAHQDYKCSEYFGVSPGTRICTSCGFEEHFRYGTATYWSSGGKTDRCGNHLEYTSKGVLDKKPLILTDDPNRYRPV